ncbi:MAG: MSMEG_4193 family putative phosphomutase [Actinomycetota bacterium]
MTVVLLIRHAHTDTAGKRLTGWARGVHLNDRGRTEAAALAERLDGVPIRAIYSSPLERCRETAAPLARARGLQVATRRGLLEVDYGEWTGRTIAGLRRTKLWRVVQSAPSRIRFPGGESLVDVQARSVAEIEHIAEAHATETIAVVTHADVVRLLVAHYAGMHLDLLQRLVIDPASVSVVALGEGAARLVKVNDTGGLDALRPRRRATPRKLRG